ncbi:hypothetical protein OG884_27035 [Streptosporangium sp. NBC_01755]|nr:hypothetical protein [Streptosporangium sp. NBC_01755]WSC98501.1 hypothetical protein OG884_27035 [Streptosporangium sp. NBC_01755]
MSSGSAAALQLVQGGEGQGGLRSGSPAAQDDEPLGAILDVPEQRRLADAWIAPEHAGPALPSLGPVKKTVEDRGLPISPIQHG